MKRRLGVAALAGIAIGWWSHGTPPAPQPVSAEIRREVQADIDRACETAIQTTFAERYPECLVEDQSVMRHRREQLCRQAKALIEQSVRQKCEAVR